MYLTDLYLPHEMILICPKLVLSFYLILFPKLCYNANIDEMLRNLLSIRIGKNARTVNLIKIVLEYENKTVLKMLNQVVPSSFPHCSQTSFLKVVFILAAIAVSSIYFYTHGRTYLLTNINTAISAFSNPKTNFSTSCHFVQLSIDKPKVKRCYPLLLNYADKCCKTAQINNCLTGLRHGINQCLSLNKTIFDDDLPFIQKNKKLLSRARGAGYWLWKPYMLFRELYLARDGDVIVYSDAAVNFVANISHLLQLTNTQDVLVFHLSASKVRDLEIQQTHVHKNLSLEHFRMCPQFI